MKIIKKNNSSFFKNFLFLMNNSTFKSFYKKYCDTWTNINTVIIFLNYMKLSKLVIIINLINIF